MSYSIFSRNKLLSIGLRDDLACYESINKQVDCGIYGQVLL